MDALHLQPAPELLPDCDGWSAGGSPARVEAARAIVEAGVAVMGHVGLTPQSVSVLGEETHSCTAVPATAGAHRTAGCLTCAHPQICTPSVPEQTVQAPCSCTYEQTTVCSRPLLLLPVLRGRQLASVSSTESQARAHWLPGGFRPQAQVASEAVRVINQAKALQTPVAALPLSWSASLGPSQQLSPRP